MNFAVLPLTLIAVPTAEHPGDREWNPLTRLAYQTPRTYQVSMGVRF